MRRMPHPESWLLRRCCVLGPADSCRNGRKDESEVGVDCGGSCAQFKLCGTCCQRTSCTPRRTPHCAATIIRRSSSCGMRTLRDAGPQHTPRHPRRKCQPGPPEKSLLLEVWASTE